jgi:hypothetical protein
MINDTEEALKHVLEETSKVICKLTEDQNIREVLQISLMAIAAGSFKIGFEKGRLRGRAE